MARSHGPRKVDRQATFDFLKTVLSICIPTYNRVAHLSNCLQSILSSQQRSRIDFEVCVSDNGSSDGTRDVVSFTQKKMPIHYKRNPENLGIPRNFLNTVEMASGEFVWLLGDDDLLLPDAVRQLSDLIHQHPKVDYFYVNSFHLTSQYVFSFPQPFAIENLPQKMDPFSSWPQSGEMSFMDLIDPKISFDFLGGMYLSVFRREKWLSSAHVIDKEALEDSRTFSHFDNTFPHIKIFANAFARSQAFFHATPLSVCLTGAREWAPMYPFVKSIRIVEALDQYRKNGLPFFRYLRCKNFALNTFIPDLVYMVIHRESSGFIYLRLKKLWSYLVYPNLYFSFFYYFVRKMKMLVKRFFNDQYSSSN